MRVWSFSRGMRGLRTAALVSGLCLSLAACPLILLGGVAGGALIATDRRSVGTQTDDREIQIRSAAQLASDLPDAAHVDVAVFNRRVLLVGEVPDAKSKELASAIVRNVNNVQGIVNELAVQGASSLGSRSNDSFITSKVKASIVAEKNLSANFFKVVTERGIVYLMGLVTRDEGNDAADVASKVPGVVQVVKVFQYITPESAGDRGGSPNASSALEREPDSASATRNPPPSTEVTSTAVSNSTVTAQPLDKQPPAPITSSTSIQPGNRKASQ